MNNGSSNPPEEAAIALANCAGTAADPESYDALVEWSRAIGLLSGREAESLISRASSDHEAAALACSRSTELRETLFELFSALALRRTLPLESIARLEQFVYELARRRRLEQSGEGAAWTWRIVHGDLDAMLWPLVEAATTLLTTNRVARVKMCAGEGCSRLFIDNSQKRNRLWCDMNVCGNRAKARRHYERAKSVTPVEAKSVSTKAQTVPDKPKTRDDGAFVWMR